MTGDTGGDTGGDSGKQGLPRKVTMSICADLSYFVILKLRNNR